MNFFKLPALVVLICSLAYVSSCVPDNVPAFNIESIEGMVPIYKADMTIGMGESRETLDPGKILVYGDILLISDVGHGVHVINNSNVSTPEKLFFIAIPGNSDMTIREGVLYVDNGPDLVSLEVTEEGVTELHRIEDIFFSRALSQKYPPQENVYFQCPDPERGEVVAWKREVIHDPSCYKGD